MPFSVDPSVAPGRRANPGHSGATSAVTARVSMAGAVAIDPLARQRDRPTGIGPPRPGGGEKKKRKKRNFSYWGVRRWRANGQKLLVRNRRARESAGASNPSA